MLGLNGPYADVTAEAISDKDAPVKVFPMWSGVVSIAPPIPRTLRGEMRAHAIFAAGANAVIAREPMGDGDVILLACPEALQNRQVGVKDHLSLLTALAGRDRPAYFDEFVHGLEVEAGVVEILRQWGFGPLLVLASAACLVAFWRRRIRIGPAEDDARETRVEAIDFVDSLALLYQRALSRRQALALYRRAFEQSVALRSGLQGAAIEKRANELLGAPLPPLREVRGRDLKPQEFSKGLQTINSALGRLQDEKRIRSERQVQRASRPT
ncbi:MAG: hypothetical protein HYY16_13785 [Planctomycetes bacterium]|nr:hypothetical protein [Planctomycetota bacterium]